jgi:hypothetical protein
VWDCRDQIRVEAVQARHFHSRFVLHHEWAVEAKVLRRKRYQRGVYGWRVLRDDFGGGAAILLRAPLQRNGNLHLSKMLCSTDKVRTHNRIRW